MAGTITNENVFFADLPSQIQNGIGALVENNGPMTVTGSLENSGTLTNAGEMTISDYVADPLEREMVRSIDEIGHLTGKKVIAEWAENQRALGPRDCPQL